MVLITWTLPVLTQRPIDLSTQAIEIALRPLGDYLGCDQCNQLLRERINNLVAQWSIVKVCCFFVAVSLLFTFCLLIGRERCSSVRTRRRTSPRSKNITHEKSPLISFSIQYYTFTCPSIIFFRMYS